MANEKRLIYAEDAKEALLGWETDPTDEEIEYTIDKLPTAKAVEVVHGRWEPHYETFDEDKAVGVWGGEYQTGWLCSVCGRYEPTEEPYCNCGAKMDGDGNA